MKNKLSVFIFRRDLRLFDNTGLINALKESEFVIPCFIFDPKQIEKNEYRSDNALEFMLNSLEELDKDLKALGSKLYIFYGDQIEVLEKIFNEANFEAIYSNRDYTPFAINRDKKISNFCNSKNIKFHSHDDYLLSLPELIKKDDGSPYNVYTPFMKKAKTFLVNDPRENKFTNYYKGKIDSEDLDEVSKKILPKKNPNIFLKGGRKEGLSLIKNIENLKDYKEIRNYPYLKGTSGLSAHHKFGTVSIRETYKKAYGCDGKDCHFISELYWRDFYTYIAFHFPHVFGHAFQKKYEDLKWQYNEKLWLSWCEGKTGYPIVDAGMRELNTTGWMHNRVRMIVASFLTKDLHIDWRLGEKYFANKLIDYDPSVNNSSWQWASSTGTDAQPYFRIFNPWLQQKKFDPECVYIKKWVPELSDLFP